MRDPAGHAGAVRLGPPGLEQHLPDPARERQVDPALRVDVAELTLADDELDAAEPMRAHRHALPRPDLLLDPRADILHPCRSTSVSATSRASGTWFTATTARSSPRR